MFLLKFPNYCGYWGKIVAAMVTVSLLYMLPITMHNCLSVSQITSNSTNRLLSGVIGLCLSGVLSRSRRRSGGLLRRSSLWRSDERWSEADRSSTASRSRFVRDRSTSFVLSMWRETGDFLNTDRHTCNIQFIYYAAILTGCIMGLAHLSHTDSTQKQNTVGKKYGTANRQEKLVW